MVEDKEMTVIDGNPNVDDNLDIIETPPEIDGEPTELSNENNIPKVQHITIDFSREDFKVPVKITATNQDQLIHTTGKLRLLHGRLYAIPIKETDANSDNYKTIKIYSNLATQIDIRCIKNGFAFVQTIVHNIEIYDGTKICILLDPIIV